MRKVQKNLKGMTLYEMIISIAVFAIMAGVLIGVGTHVDRTTRAANGMKSKIVKEAPFAANRIAKNTSGDDMFKSEDLEMTFTCIGSYSYIDHTTKSNTTVNNPSCTLNLKKYDTSAAVTGDKDTPIDPESDYNANINFQFLEVQP